jgi:colanic acid biosynthesis glycosyl transferase WcaI
MRILIYSYNYYPEPIGIAPLITELAEGLVERGHEVRVVTALPNYPERTIYAGYRGRLYCTETRNGVLIQRCFVAIRPRPGLAARLMLEGSFVTLSLVQALRGWRPDVILATSPSLPACLPVALLKAWYRCPSLLNLQDILPEAAIRTGLLTHALAIRCFEALEQFAYRSADKISVIAEGFWNNLLDKGVPAEKMVCIPNWVDVHRIQPLPQSASLFRQQHQLQDKFVVLYSGNIAHTQGLKTVIRAAKLLEGQPEIAFVIVGEPTQLHELDQFCQALGIQNVRLLPLVSRAELPDMLAGADVGLVMQKRKVVGFNMPSKIQLLLASGRPILASVPHEGTAARAVLRSGGGIVVQPEDPAALAKGVLGLYCDRARCAQLAQQGRQYAVEHFSLEQAVDRYERLLQALTSPATAADSVPAAKPLRQFVTGLGKSKV